MKIAVTLSLYVGRVFSLAVLAMAGALTALVGLFDFIELLRRAASQPAASFGIVAEIAALRLPWAAMQIIPFAVLLGGILAFWRLTRSSELIVARAAGVSAWQFLSVPVLAAILFGAFATAAISPISAVMRARAEGMESRYLRGVGSALALTGGQLWLRQADQSAGPGGVAILHATGVTLRHGQLGAAGMSVFRLDAHDQLASRIEAARATLEGGDWLLEGARVIVPGHPPGAPTALRLPTSMTVARVQESFAPPETLSVWALPGFIRLLERSGFSAIRHRLQLQTLLALPLLAGTMSLLAAGFSMRPSRRGGVALMIGS
ncbi:MAG: LptF/LptG family permease, partial [Rhodospirillales bacterium]|nr:LptF/LptG family permease [Rhodospirillales bacterium]